MECVSRTAPSIVKSNYKRFHEHALFEARKIAVTEVFDALVVGNYWVRISFVAGDGRALDFISRVSSVAVPNCTTSGGSILPVSHLDT